MKIYGRPEKSKYNFSYENETKVFCTSNFLSNQIGIITDSKRNQVAKISIDRSRFTLTLGTSFLLHLKNTNDPLKITSQGFWGNKHQFKYQNSCYHLYVHKFGEVSFYKDDVQVARFDFQHIDLKRKPTIEIDFHKNLDPLLLVSIAISLVLLKNRNADFSSSIDFGSPLDANREKYNPDWTAMN